MHEVARLRFLSFEKPSLVEHENVKQEVKRK